MQHVSAVNIWASAIQLDLTEAAWVQGEEEGSGDILDEELQQQLNEMADYTSGDEEHPAGQSSLPTFA